MGRIATVKMNILPKVLFLFQNLLFLSSVLLINDLDKALRNFVWQNKKSGIKAKHLQDKKERGGFAIPDLTTYYQESSLTWIKDWCLLQNFSNLTVKGHDLPSGWHSYLWMEGKIPHSFTIHF